MLPNFLQIPHLVDGCTNGKFIQLYASLRDASRMVDPILGVSFSGDETHGNLLIETLYAAGLSWVVGEEDNLFRKRFPSPARFEAYTLVGAGKCDYLDGEFIAYGRSEDYYAKPNIPHFESLRTIDPNFRFRLDPNKK